MKIYTKTGDQGETGLFSGGRVSKDDPLLDAYGTVDELNAILGIVRAEGLSKKLDGLLAQVQNELFMVGADLATPWEERSSSKAKVDRLNRAPTQRLESEIDSLQEHLVPLSQFILPGGVRAAGLIHLARTVCRRAERRVVGLLRQGRCNPEVAIYLNRLSDWFFVLARTANVEAGAKDQFWNKGA